MDEGRGQLPGQGGSGGGGGGEDRGSSGRLEAGAGLQESRLNQDFIAWLEKWGPRVLYAVLAVVVVYVGLQWFGRYQEQQTDAAFASLQSAIEAGDPAMLEAVAAEHADRAAVADLARLELGSLYLRAGTTRRPIGDEGGGEGGEGEGGEGPAMLSDEQAEARLNAAIEQFGMVLERTAGTKPLLAQRARWDIATARLSLGDVEGARSMIESYAAAAEELGNAAAQRAVAEERLALVSRGIDRLWLPAREELPGALVPPDPPERPATGSGGSEDIFGGFGSEDFGGEGEIDPRDPFAGSGLGLGGGSGGGDAGSGDGAGAGDGDGDGDEDGDGG